METCTWGKYKHSGFTLNAGFLSRHHQENRSGKLSSLTRDGTAGNHTHSPLFPLCPLWRLRVRYIDKKVVVKSTMASHAVIAPLMLIHRRSQVLGPTGGIQTFDCCKGRSPSLWCWQFMSAKSAWPCTEQANSVFCRKGFSPQQSRSGLKLLTRAKSCFPFPSLVTPMPVRQHGTKSLIYTSCQTIPRMRITLCLLAKHIAVTSLAQKWLMKAASIWESRRFAPA